MALSSTAIVSKSVWVINWTSIDESKSMTSKTAVAVTVAIRYRWGSHVQEDESALADEVWGWEKCPTRMLTHCISAYATNIYRKGLLRVARASLPVY